jgi:DNA invertase Pin-like site-specific DNA recombinase
VAAASPAAPCQIEEAREYFAGQGWPVDERLIFSDNDISASPFSDKERPGWLDLLAAIRAGLIQRVIVTEVPRLCRNLPDAMELIALTKETSFTTVELTNGVRYDLTTVHGYHDFLKAVLNASGESGKSSVRLKRKKRARAKEGYYNGGSRPYGYRKPEGGATGTLEVVESEAAIVRELVERLLAGEMVMPLVATERARGPNRSRWPLVANHSDEAGDLARDQGRAVQPRHRVPGHLAGDRLPQGARAAASRPVGPDAAAQHGPPLHETHLPAYRPGRVRCLRR